jgi:hypothetical protein
MTALTVFWDAFPINEIFRFLQSRDFIWSESMTPDIFEESQLTSKGSPLIRLVIGQKIARLGFDRGMSYIL